MAIGQTASYVAAARHLARQDRRLGQLIGHVGPCTLQTRPHAFRVLTSSIISQQISGKAAESISKRVRALCSRGGITPQRIADLDDAALRGAGLSNSKLLSLRSLSRFFVDNPALVRRLKSMPDEDVIAALVPIRGIGVWTAQMFLIFCLGRLDVLPTGDLGFKAGVRDVYGFDDFPDHDDMEQLAESWRPYRTIATWYLWRGRGFVAPTQPNSSKRRAATA